MTNNNSPAQQRQRPQAARAPCIASGYVRTTAGQTQAPFHARRGDPCHTAWPSSNPSPVPCISVHAWWQTSMNPRCACPVCARASRCCRGASWSCRRAGWTARPLESHRRRHPERSCASFPARCGHGHAAGTGQHGQGVDAQGWKASKSGTKSFLMQGHVREGTRPRKRVLLVIGVGLARGFWIVGLLPQRVLPVLCPVPRCWLRPCSYL